MHSMTAFARGAIQDDWGSLVIEIKSVNHRYLDATIRLPDHCRHLEMVLREKIRDYLARGKVEINIRFVAGEATTNALRLNHPLLKQLLQVRAEIASELGNSPPSDPMALLQWPGIVLVDEVDYHQVNQAIIVLFESTLKQLCDERRKEGEALKVFLLQHLTLLEQRTREIQKRLPQVLINYHKKLVDRITDINMDYEPNRLEQELILISQRTDVAEEIERLATHITNAREQFQKPGAIGRHLDFLMQEFHRESNTLGVKCNDVEISQLSVEVKVIIEKMREQIQNIE